jgi:hypothetical protein
MVFGFAVGSTIIHMNFLFLKWSEKVKRRSRIPLSTVCTGHIMSLLLRFPYMLLDYSLSAGQIGSRGVAVEPGKCLPK